MATRTYYDIKRIISLLLAVSFLFTSTDVVLAKEIFVNKCNACLAPTSKFKPLVDVQIQDGKINIDVNPNTSETGLDPTLKNDTAFLYLSQSIGQVLYLDLADANLTDFKLELDKKCSHLLNTEIYNYREMYLGEDGAIYLPYKNREYGVEKLLRYFKPDKDVPLADTDGAITVSLDDEKPVWVKAVELKSQREPSAIGVTGNASLQFSRYLSEKGHAVNDIAKPEDLFSLPKIRQSITESSILYSLGDLDGVDAVPARSDYARILSANGLLTGVNVRLIQDAHKEGSIRFIYGSTYLVSCTTDSPEIRSWLDEAIKMFDLHINKIIWNDNAKDALEKIAADYIELHPVPGSIGIYTLSKMLGERFVRRLKNSVIVRMAEPYGFGDYTSKDRITKLIKEQLAGQTSKITEADRDYIYYKDMFEILENLSKEDTKVNKLVDLVSRETVSAQKLKDLLREAISETLGKIEIIPSKKLPFEPLDRGSVKSLLGREFTPFLKGLSESIKYLKKNLREEMKARLPGKIVKEFTTGGSAAEVFLIEKPNGQRSIVKCATIEGVDSNGMEKLKGEHDQFQFIRSKVPKAVQDRWATTIAFKDFRPDGFNMTYTEMPLYDGAESLADFLLRPDRNMDRYSRILNSVLTMLFDNVYYQDIAPAPPDSMERFYLGRAERRIKVLREKDSSLKAITEAEYLTINGVRYRNIMSLIGLIRNNRQLYESLKPKYLSLSPHGDLLINNILLLNPDDETDDNYIICDVRGEGTKSWDPLYDFAKTKHSLNGHNFVRRGLFTLDVDEEAMSFDLKFDQSNPAWRKYASANNEFIDLLDRHPGFKKMKDMFPHWKEQLLFDEAMHFVCDSACRLVDYSEKNQAIAAYLIGVVLLNNFLQQQGAISDASLSGKAGEWQISGYSRNLPIILDGKPSLVPYSGIAHVTGDLVSGSALRKEAVAVDTYLMNNGKEPIFLFVWGEYFEALGIEEKKELVRAVNELEAGVSKELYLKLIEKGYGQLTREDKMSLVGHKNMNSPITARYIAWIIEIGKNGTFSRVYEAAESLVRYQADMLAEEINLIYEGEVGASAMVSPEFVKGTRKIGIGGRLLQGKMGKIFLGELNSELENILPGAFQVIPIEADSTELGLAGAGALVSQGVLTKAAEKARRDKPGKPLFIIAIDAGGTKVGLAGQVIDENNKVTNKLVHKEEHKIDFSAGPNKYYHRIAEMVNSLRNDLEEEGYIAVDVVGVGHLGHKFPDGTIIPGTISSFGENNSFEGVDPAVMIKKSLREIGINVEVEWSNDSLSQGAEACRRIIKNQAISAGLKGEKLVYFGLGTGLGSSFFKIGPNGNIEYASVAEIHSDNRILKYDLNENFEVLEADKVSSDLFEFNRDGFNLALQFYDESRDVSELKRSLKDVKGVLDIKWQDDELTIISKNEVVKFHPRGIEINERLGLKDRFYVRVPTRRAIVAVKSYHRDIRDTDRGRTGPVYVLGVGRNSHDSAAALIKDGVIIGAIEEERLNLNKHTHAYFPKEATRYLLGANGITWKDIDHIAVMWDYNLYKDTPHSLAPYRHFIKRHGILGTAEELSSKYDTSRLQAFLEGMAVHYETSYVPPVTFVKHHKAHAAAAWYTNDFPEPTLVVTIDGRGEDEATTIWLAKNDRLKKISGTAYIHSLGMLYEIVTKYLGFKRHDEGKVMGFAPYGAPKNIQEEAVVNKLRDIMKKMVRFDPQTGRIEMDQKYFNYASLKNTADLNFSESCLKEISAIVPVMPKTQGGSKLMPENRGYAHLAFAMQERIEQVIMEMVSFYFTECPETRGVKHLAMSGGIALNIITNGRLIEKGIVDADKIFVPAYPADDGAPIGAALSVSREEYGLNVKHKVDKISLGRAYTDQQIKAVLDQFGLKEGEDYVSLRNDEEIIDKVASAIMNNETVAWFQGGSELGPRALGNRSILNRLDDPEGNLKVNRIKGREPWRPSAMSIQEERAAEFLDGIIKSPFMTIAFPVTEDKKGVIKAGAHPADGTTRPQTVSREANPLYWSLLVEMGKRSGIPAVLNTSFNRIGPIVETPQDALNTFFYSDGLDQLAIGHFLIKSKDRIIPTILNGRDEKSLKDILNKAISDGNPLSDSWSIFWAKANELAGSRRPDNQRYLVVYADDKGVIREIIRAPLVKEMFQDGTQQVMIASLAGMIQRKLANASVATIAIETTARDYNDVVVDLFRQFTPYIIVPNRADIKRNKIRTQLEAGDYETPIDFTDLNDYLEKLSPNEAKKLFIKLDLIVKSKGLVVVDVQVRYLFLKLLARGRDEFLDASCALTDSVKNKVREVVEENDWMFAYVAVAVLHSLVEDGSIRNISKKQLYNVPKIFFVSPIRPTAKDDKYGHYIGAGYFRFQQTSQIIAASYLEIFGIQAEVFDLSFGEREVEKLKEAIDDRTSIISLRLNGPITQADLDTIFMLEKVIKDKFADGKKAPILTAGGRSAAFRAQELLDTTPIQAIFRGLSETDMVNIACDVNFNRTRSVGVFQGLANIYTDKSLKPPSLKRRKLLAQMQLETSFAVADFRKVDLRECWKDLPKNNIHPQTKPFAQPSVLLFTGYPDVCMRGCEFCHYYLGGEASLRISPEGVIDLIKRILDVYPEIKLFNITDGDMLADREWVEKFAECFENEGLRKRGIKFLAYACVSSCKDAEYLKMLKNKLNIETITFGEEVASIELLRDMKKSKPNDDPRDRIRVPALALESGIPYIRTTFILYYPTIGQSQLIDSMRMIADFTEKGFNVSVNPYVLPRPPAPLAKSKKSETLTVEYPLPNGKTFNLEHIFVPNDKLIAEVAERSITDLRGEVTAILRESGWQKLAKSGWKDSMAEVPPQVEVLALIRLTIRNLMKRDDCQVSKKELKEVSDRIDLATRNFMVKAIKDVERMVSDEDGAAGFEVRQEARVAKLVDAVKVWNSAAKRPKEAVVKSEKIAAQRRAKIIAIEVKAWGDSVYETKVSNLVQALQRLVNVLKTDGAIKDIEIVVANSSKSLVARVAEAKEILKSSGENIDIAILASEDTIASGDLKALRDDHAFLAYVDKENIKESCMDIMLPETITVLIRKLTGLIDINEINDQFEGMLKIELDSKKSQALGVLIYRIIPNAKRLDIKEFEKIFNLQIKEIERQA